MKQTPLILITLILLSSCATIINQPYTGVNVRTTEPSKIIYKQDTIKTVNNEINLWVERKKETLSFVAMTDTIAKTIEVKSRHSNAFWLGNLFSGAGVIGYAIDLTSPKRFTYQKRVYINSGETIGKYYRYNPVGNNKGELLLHLSLPHINSFCLNPKNENYKINTGFWGLSIGFDYYYLKNKFVNLSVSGVSDFWVPVPAAIDMSGEYELMSSGYISLSNNYRIKRFTIGYGLSFGRNTWDFRYYDWGESLPPTREPVKKSHNTLGFIFPTYFQIGEYFNIGVVYRPSFYRPNLPDKFSYEHLISIDFAWKIRIKK